MPISLGIGTAVTRGGGLLWSPLSISGLQFWVDAADSATLYTDSALTTLAVADGDDVGGWKDKSGNSRNALQNDGTKKPMLKTAIQNGRNVVRTDGVNDLLDLAYDANGLAGFTLITVIKKVSPGTTYYVCGSGDSNGSSKTTWGAIDVNPDSVAGAVALHHSDGATFSITRTAGSVIAGNTFTLGCTKYTSGNTQQSFRKNATNIANATVLYSDASTCGGTPYKFILGQFGEFVGINLNGDIAELLVYDQALPLPDLQKVEDYLNAKWSVY